jgi:hypothetical protein
MTDNKQNKIVNKEDGDISAQISEMRDKWGVSAEEVQQAIENVGTNRQKLEEYFVNNRYQGQTNSPSFEKRELNEDESY